MLACQNLIAALQVALPEVLSVTMQPAMHLSAAQGLHPHQGKAAEVRLPQQGKTLLSVNAATLCALESSHVLQVCVLMLSITSR